LNIKNIKPGAGFAIFIVFFGISVLEAYRTRHWLMVAFWLVIAIAFLLMDTPKSKA
jgi:hypothetical protein